MLINEVEKFVSQDDGLPISELSTDNSRFDKIGIKQLNNGLQVRARDEEADEVHEIEFNLVDMTFQGIEPADGQRRDDIPADLLDALHSGRYCCIDRATMESLSEDNA